MVKFGSIAITLSGVLVAASLAANQTTPKRGGVLTFGRYVDALGNQNSTQKMGEQGGCGNLWFRCRLWRGAAPGVEDGIFLRVRIVGGTAACDHKVPLFV